MANAQKITMNLEKGKNSKKKVLFLLELNRDINVYMYRLMKISL